MGREMDSQAAFHGPNAGYVLELYDRYLSDPASLDFFPRWSADGELIVFLRTTGERFVNDLGTPDPDAHAELWIMRSAGSGARLLLDDVRRIGSYYGLFPWEQVVAWWPSADAERSAEGTD